ncbi:MAG TPA: metal ABC transporter permease [Solirubrobacteraceae bacterium]|nr:metal ABC transporter permease [Solirubrobacteraceae bacterium]
MSITQRALLEAVLLGLACGPLSVWLLAYRHTYAAESLAHAMLPGLALASAAGAPLLLGGTGGILAAALLIGLASRDHRIGPEVAIGVTVTGLFGLGALLALDADTPLGDLLFGDLLGVTDGDLVAAAALAVGVPFALLAGHRPLAATAFAPALTRRPQRVQAALLVLLAVAVVVAVQGLGNLLVLALLVAPGVAAPRLARRLGAQLAVAAALAAGSGALGVLASDRLGTAAGASVALVLVLVAVAALLARGGDGVSRPSPVEALTGRP